MSTVTEDTAEAVASSCWKYWLTDSQLKCESYFLSQTKDDGGRVTNANQIAAWGQKDVDARTYIYSTVKPEQQTKLHGCTTAAEMWDRIQTEYAEMAAENAHLLMAKLYDCKFQQSITWI